MAGPDIVARPLKWMELDRHSHLLRLRHYVQRVAVGYALVCGTVHDQRRRLTRVHQTRIHPPDTSTTADTFDG